MQQFIIKLLTTKFEHKIRKQYFGYFMTKIREGDKDIVEEVIWDKIASKT